MKRFLLMAVAALASCVATFGQYTNVLDGGITQTVDSVWNVGLPLGEVRVGTTTSNNALKVINGGQVTASHTYIGEFSSSSNNLLSIKGTNANWFGEGLFAGYGGSANKLEISDGAQVNIEALYVGREMLASNNVTVISGEGTRVVAAVDILSGASGDGNTLVIADGASVESLWGGVGFASTAQNNTLIVTDAGTSWNITNDLWVGYQGDGNKLIIADGATVENENGYVGFYTEGPYSDSNLVTVVGSGSEWVNRGTLRIGASGAASNIGNSVVVSDNGTVSASNLVIQGEGNSFNLNDGGTLAITADFDVDSQTNLNWNGGGHLSVGGTLTLSGGLDGTNRTLSVDGGSWGLGTNDLTVSGQNNQLNIINGGGVTNGDGYVVGSDNSVVVSDSGSEWRNNGGILQIDGSGNALTVSNNAWVYVGEVTTNDLAGSPVGGIAVASTNDAKLIADNGAYVETTGGFYIGTTNGLTGSVTVTNDSTIKTDSLTIESGSGFNLNDGGKLVITSGLNVDDQTNLNWNSGGHLSVEGALTLSAGLDGTNRILSIDGGNWDLGTNDLQIAGLSNQLNIVNGGGVTNANGNVGISAADSNNTVLVSGTGSHWQNDGSLNIGSAATNSGNSVTVASGGRVTADTLTIEDNNSFNLNSGGTLEMTGSFHVEAHSNLNWKSGGNLSVGGTLTGTASASNAVLGQVAVLDQGRHLTLDGSGAVWSHADTNLVIGYGVPGSKLTVTDGATLDNADGYIGWGSGIGNNVVEVSGAGSTWTNRGGQLYVGTYWSGTNLLNTGSGNTLTIKDSAWVLVGEGQTNQLTNPTASGLLVASTNGAELIVGNGSVNVEETLYLGVDSSSTATNIIRNGGTVSVGDVVIADGSLIDLLSGGTFAIGTNFNVTTTGFEWGNGAKLSVGGILSGMASTNIGGVDYALLENEQDLTLDGGSWNIAGTNLLVGVDSSFSDLLVKNTGTLFSATTYIGFGSNAANNSITIESGSVWDNSGELYVGFGGSSNRLVVTSGGVVNNGSAFIGNTNTIGNYVQVSGSNSEWNVSGNLRIGNSGTNNYLQVLDGASVEVDDDLFLDSKNGMTVASESSVSIGGDINISSNTAVVGGGTFELSDNASILRLIGQNIAISNSIVFEGSGSNLVEVSDGTFTVDETLTNQYVGFQTLELSDSTLAGVGAVDAFGVIDMTGGRISPGGSGYGLLEISGDFSSTGTIYKAGITKSEHDELVFTGTNTVNLNGLGVDIHVVAVPTNPVVSIISAAGGLNGSIASTNAVVRPLLFKAVLGMTSNNITVSVVGNDEKFSSALAYAGAEGTRAGFNSMKNSVFTRTKQLRRNLVATSHAIPHAAFLLSSTNAPAGAQGPGDLNTIFDFNMWVQHFSGEGDYERSGDSYGFAMNNYGTTIGFDKLIGEALVVGANYTYSRTHARTTNDDRMDTETYWVGAYGEWVGEEGLYVDALAGYGFSSYDSVRVEENYRGTAIYDGYGLGGYVDVGQYYHYKNLALSPYVGLHYLGVATDEHIETETEGDELTVDKFTHSWLETVLGLKLRHRFNTRIGRFQTTGYAEWAHDYIQEDIYSTLSANGLPAVDMARISPDADVFNTGVGFSWLCTDSLEVGVGYNGRFSERYEEHTGSAMLNLMF
jgi:outer membrane autotransporter protein